MSEDMAVRALSFGARAEQYQRTRPTYPPELLDAVLPAGAKRVADVGAGTGKLTALLCDRGLLVTAVEPDPGMRAVLARTAPTATVVEGTGEEIPLPDASVDAVTFAQAWHWVDHARGYAEAARVLAPGGALILIWNARPDGAPGWVVEVDDITRGGAAVGDFAEIPRHPLFDAPMRVEIPWSESISRSQLLERAMTWSAVATLPEDERADVLDRLGALLDEQLTDGDDLLPLPHVTLGFRYSLR